MTFEIMLNNDWSQPVLTVRVSGSKGPTTEYGKRINSRDISGL